jgi:predicted dehydrogenase
MRVAIVGCGKIADQHVQAIRRIADTAIVAVCDREPLMAGQLAERFRIDGQFADVANMLAKSHPDVVHITTPPQSHHDLGRQCLEAGSHVYLEKPFTVTADQADALIRFAESRNLLVTAGHNYQFTPEMLQMRTLCAQGFLGVPRDTWKATGPTTSATSTTWDRCSAIPTTGSDVCPANCFTT